MSNVTCVIRPLRLHDLLNEEAVMTKEEEKSLLQRAKAKDMDAFESIVRANERLLYNYALRMLCSREDAGDAVQETFIKAYSGMDSFRGESRLSVWLCRILNNVCVDMLRKRRDTVPLSLTSEDGEESTLMDIPDERFDPAAMLERKDLRERVREAVESLPEDFRAPLLLREYGDHSYAEIARILSLDMGTVKTRIFRARKKLCALLAKDGNNSAQIPSESTEGGAQT